MVNKRVLQGSLWIVLFVISGGIALWFSVEALMGAYIYLELDTQTPAKLSSLEVQEQGESRYLYQARYVYEVKGKVYRGETLFCEPVYLNKIAADADLEKWRQLHWDAWYNAKRPQESSLQRFFPFKKCLYSLLAIGVCIYFLCLRYFAFSKSIWKNDL